MYCKEKKGLGRTIGNLQDDRTRISRFFAIFSDFFIFFLFFEKKKNFWRKLAVIGRIFSPFLDFGPKMANSPWKKGGSIAVGSIPPSKGDQQQPFWPMPFFWAQNRFRGSHWQHVVPENGPKTRNSRFIAKNGHFLDFFGVFSINSDGLMNFFFFGGGLGAGHPP